MGILDKAKQVGQLNEMRKQAQQIQKVLEAEKISHSYAGGSIKISIRGDQKIDAITIDENWLKTQSHQKIETSLKEAINQAVYEAQKVAAKKLQGLGGGLGLPGL
jgi:DNA-binding protein YbaB